MSAGISSDQRRKEQGNQGMFGPSFGQQSNYNYFPNNGDYNNAWGSQHMNSSSGQQQQQQYQHSSGARRGGASHDDYYRRDDGVKSIEHGVQGIGLDSHRQSDGGNYRDSNSSATNATKSQDQPKEPSVPKKMTWASIASQPAKPQIRANSSSSTLKKKGPGMPPPPMVPGKHNMDIGTWDSPKNGSAMVPTPVPVPSPPPPIIEPSPLGQPLSKSHNNNNNNNINNNSNSNVNNSGSNANAATANINNSSASNNNNNHTMPHSQLSNNQYPEISRSHHPQQHGRGDRDRDRDREHERERDGPNMHRQNWHGPSNRGPPVHSGGMYHHPPSQQQHRSNYGPSGQGPPMNYHQGPPNHQSYGGGMNSNRPSYRPPQSNHPQGHNTYSNNGKGFAVATPAPVQDVEPEPPAIEIEVDPVPVVDDKSPVLDELRYKNNYNPPELNLDGVDTARFFIIKSYSEDDIHRSIKYEIWCSTEHGNKRLDEAFRQRKDDESNIYLLFSVNGSGHFCGMAQMITPVDYNSVSGVWHQDKWKGQFKVKWIYVKDVPNQQLRHIRLENNENKPVTNSRDTQEVPNAKGQQVLQIIHSFKHTTSIFDDFIHYEKRQVEEGTKKVDGHGMNDGAYDSDERNGPYPYHGPPSNYQGGVGRGYHGANNYDKGHGNYHGGYDNRHGYDNRDNRGRVGNNFGGPGGGNRGYHNYDNRRGPGGNDDYHPRGSGGFDRPSRDYRDNRRDDRGGGFMSRNRDPPRDFDGNRGGGYDNHNRDRNGGDHSAGGFNPRSGPPRDRDSVGSGTGGISHPSGADNYRN